MAALTQFVARRGLPHSVYSNSGTNFVGASRELADFYNLLNSKGFQKVVSNLAKSKRIRWYFSLAHASHFSGLSEAGVNSMKKILRKTLPPHLLNFEEFSTLLADVEAIRNSRPILHLNTTPPDIYLALTSGHFLVGNPLTLSGYEDEYLALLKRSDLVRWLSHDIWKQWSTSYLQTLQDREKWKNATLNFQAGDIVILKDKILLQLIWPLACVIATYPGFNGLVRVVDFLCQGKTYNHPITRLVKMISAETDPPLSQLSPREDVQAS